jgi:branched-chain amino acid transport system substrate-binding protein
VVVAAEEDTANPAYSDTALAAFRAEVERLGGWQLEVRPLRVGSFEPAGARELMRDDVDALYILAGLFQPAIGHLGQLFHQLHPQAPILLTPWARSPGVIGTLGPAAAHTLITSPFPARRGSAAVKRYAERFEQRFSYRPGAISLSTRQAIELLDQALASGASSPAEVKRHLLARREHRTSRWRALRCQRRQPRALSPLCRNGRAGSVSGLTLAIERRAG